MEDFQKLRKQMVLYQIEERGVTDELVLKAMRKVPREYFVPLHLSQYAYEDAPLPIGNRQTISQPFIVAYMVEALNLKGGEKVLEVGAGSGYAAAVLAEIASDVFTIERIGALAKMASTNLSNAGYSSVNVRHDDGTLGWEEAAPFDAILVSAGAPDIPKTLQSQLKIGGVMVIPAGQEKWRQELIRVTRTSENEFVREYLTGVHFVPLIGGEGWNDEKDA